MRLAVSASELLKSVETPQLKKKVPAFVPGDTVRVTLRVPEGDKERQQVFEGVVIGRHGGGSREMVTVRKISFGIGVERSFPLHSPFIAKIERVGRGKARRAKLYFLRDKTGKAARLKRRNLSAAEIDSEAVDAAGAEAEAVAALPAEDEKKGEAAVPEKKEKKKA